MSKQGVLIWIYFVRFFFSQHGHEAFYLSSQSHVNTTIQYILLLTTVIRNSDCHKYKVCSVCTIHTFHLSFDRDVTASSNVTVSLQCMRTWLIRMHKYRKENDNKIVLRSINCHNAVWHNNVICITQFLSNLYQTENTIVMGWLTDLLPKQRYDRSVTNANVFRDHKV